MIPSVIVEIAWHLPGGRYHSQALLPLIADGATRISDFISVVRKMAYGHTSAALSQFFITPRPTANLFGCSLPN